MPNTPLLSYLSKIIPAQYRDSLITEKEVSIPATESGYGVALELVYVNATKDSGLILLINAPNLDHNEKILDIYWLITYAGLNPDKQPTEHEIEEFSEHLHLILKSKTLHTFPNYKKEPYINEISKWCFNTFSRVHRLILNVIDEAHHGQAKGLAELRDTTFPCSTNYLFTATYKDEMLRYYFGDNVDIESLIKKGLCSRFTLSDALACDTTVRVAFLKPSKIVDETEKTKEFSEILNEKISASVKEGSTAFDYDDELESVIVSADQVTTEIRKLISADTTFEKIKAIASFMDTGRQDLPFFPKAIVYVSSVEQANKYIEAIQAKGIDNEYLGYRWGIDHSSLDADCPKLNPGITTSSDVEKRFGVIRPLAATPEQLKEMGIVIDILVVVDKYQKGFDLPVLLATFLDAPIGEPAKMSQIYTRAGTKYPGKHLGFCIDLTLDNKNKETFELAMALFDSKDLSLLIDDLAFKKAMAEIELSIAAIKRILSLKDDEFVAGLIVSKLFENVSVAERRVRQDMFFRSVQTIQNTLKTISATFFYKPYRLELMAIRQALEAFKDIYADASHPLHVKVEINLDKSAGGSVFSAKMIRQLILETLAQMDLLPIKSVVEIEYTPDKSTRISGSNGHEALMKRIQAETKGKSLLKLMDDLGEHLKKNGRSLV